MKITFVLANWVSLSGGVQSNADLAYHLQKRGHEVYIVCPQKRRPTVVKQVKSLLKGKGLIPSKHQGPSHLDGMDLPREVLDHPPPVTDADLPDADIVVATWWETAEWVANLSPSKGAKVYMIRHHETHDYLPIERVAATYRLPFHKIVISQWLVDIMDKEYGDKNVSLVPNSIDAEKYYAEPRKKQTVPTVGMLYSPLSWKGCDITLKALALASQQIPQLKLVCFGTKPPVPELPLPPGSEFFCQPPQDQIKHIYASCDAWLFGSRFEGFGRPILEAMACRTPVIGVPAGAAPELLCDGIGILVKPEDPEDMAEAIVKICQMSQEQWRQMSDRAYNKATSYTWDDAAQLCEQAFEIALGS
ncbi:MAG: glycosyltransferase family 4 protein [Planktothrix sp.]